MAADVSPHAALVAFLEHLANERRASPRTIEAYRAAGLSYLSFLGQHFGGALALADLGSLSAGDIRAFLAHRRSGEHPLSARSLSQCLSAARSSNRFLDRRQRFLPGAGPGARPQGIRRRAR
jgi:integrase/recombinase XerC